MGIMNMVTSVSVSQKVNLQQAYDRLVRLANSVSHGYNMRVPDAEDRAELREIAGMIREAIGEES